MFSLALRDCFVCLLSVDEWRSHDDTAELSNLFSPTVDQAEPSESDNDGDGSESSGSEQMDDEDESNFAAAAEGSDDDNQDSNDDDSDDATCTTLSSRNPFALLADDS